LLACLLAIPVGIFVKSKATSQAQFASSSDELPNLTRRDDRIAVMRLSGMIMEDDDSVSLFAKPSPAALRKKIHKAAADDSIKGILLRINSPGGTVGLSQEIYDAVKEFRSKGKPIYVSMGDITASGGYYVASGADKIYANPGTLTGSIGVIMHLLDLEGIEKKLGIAPMVVKSGEFKDIGSSDRPMTAAEKALLQSIIMDSYDQFVSAIASGRKMKKDTVLKLADGRIFSGRQALKAGLIDELGGYEQALACLQKTLNKKNDKDTDYPVDDSYKAGFLSQFLESTSSIGANSDPIGSFLPKSLQSQFTKQPLWLME
jgi:protease-4